MRDYVNRRDVASFTGRQVAWDFANRSIKESPLLGYGYEVEGQYFVVSIFRHGGFDIKDSASAVIRGNVAQDAAESNGIYQENCANTLRRTTLSITSVARCRDVAPESNRCGFIKDKDTGQLDLKYPDGNLPGYSVDGNTQHGE
jgi:hypothetical protein